MNEDEQILRGCHDMMLTMMMIMMMIMTLMTMTVIMTRRMAAYDDIISLLSFDMVC